MTNATDGVRLAARIVDTPCNEMNTDTFLEVRGPGGQARGWDQDTVGIGRPQGGSQESWGQRGAVFIVSVLCLGLLQTKTYCPPSSQGPAASAKGVGG